MTLAEKKAQLRGWREAKVNQAVDYMIDKVRERVWLKHGEEITTTATSALAVATELLLK